MKIVKRPRKINAFTLEYEWLSNFFPCEIKWDGLVYPTVEHAYQAMKFPCLPKLQAQIAACRTAGQAKRMGRTHPITCGYWDEKKLGVMSMLLTLKFRFDSALGDELRHTQDDYLEEGNHWGDTYWGVCNGVGLNHLGLLLMERRKALWMVYQQAHFCA